MASDLKQDANNLLDWNITSGQVNQDVFSPVSSDHVKPVIPLTSPTSIELLDILMKGSQQEEAEWESINALLTKNGLKPVCFVNRAHGKNLGELIIFDKQTAQRIRQTLKRLVDDSAMNQNMIHQLIEANQQLRDELQQEQSRTLQEEKRANDLGQIVNSVKSKIIELEEESEVMVSQQQNQVKEFKKDQKAAQAKYQQCEQKWMEQQKTLSCLQKEILKFQKEEELRDAAQKRVFKRLCKQATHTTVDKQLVILIDYYESKIRKLQKELSHYKEDSVSEGEKEDFINLDGTPNYKNLLMSFQNQLRDTKAKNDKLSCENLNLRKDLESRPSPHDLRLYKQQVKKLEKALKKSVKLQEVLREDKSESLDNRDSEIRKTDSQHQALFDQKYFKILTSIDSIISNPRAPVVIYKQSKGSFQSYNKINSQECGFEHLPLTIEMWADQLTSLKDLHRSLEKLSEELLPWHNKKQYDRSEGGIKVEDLLLIVDTILEEVEHKQKGDVPCPETLQAIVNHFQKLFDVTSLSGIYPRMNEVYIRLGEMNNAVRNIYEILELDNSSSLSVLVNTVGKLCKIINEDVSKHIEQVLGTQDIQSIINKLEEYDEFFPTFQAFIQDLLQILEVNNLDAIIPEVMKLKLIQSKED
ncbi:centrosomal protein of 70 kDa isoform X1 [Monodelphis domestica]|uniref:Centrosomal protein of 70 kDa n=2 Tax=Monodelphis domestica TaxID=13616 RepID=F7FRD6_MONDO|nr:centrosomal protein of 70 kDa isoform X1 [Monodelphis domestica]XP_007494001.1 centrosomal protein of 70 kDa isoform X1 [Monodelphis domestica]XP_007494002.1 centrosomal protein of 70 kDa isoform X1 [Monodelphis domestica]XP_007494003.1 centrosomal protein of 70 kDa isoform X1 [Monodelphis domestica]